MTTGNLFSQNSTHAPLADRMRPRCLDEIYGQEALVGPNTPLRKLIEIDQLPSLIFWGPPGSGKTTLARVIAVSSKNRFVAFSAVTSNINEVRQIIARAGKEQQFGQRTILFIDEIHRFNRTQQDAFLPHVEYGTVVLIGATTENPSFEVNAALLSRTRVFPLISLTICAIKKVLQTALSDPDRGIANLQTDPDVLDLIAYEAEGDARRALNALEIAASAAKNGHLSTKIVRKTLGKKVLLYDKNGEEHYNLISAFHKSLRGSDPHAALYWLSRMIEAGEAPHYLLRRMVRFASEDIGNADPKALSIALAAKESYDFLGSPEGDLALAQACIYLATAPKSNAIYSAYGKVIKDIQEQPNLPVPLHIRNASTKFTESLGYGEGYRYAHDDPNGYTPQDYLPENLRDRQYYKPTNRGYEKQIQILMNWWENLRNRKTQK